MTEILVLCFSGIIVVLLSEMWRTRRMLSKTNSNIYILTALYCDLAKHFGVTCVIKDPRKNS